jgi:peptidoglycan/LPS O-acetylase OafA/YrhL
LQPVSQADVLGVKDHMPLYLPNLNGVRFMAALTVVLSHVELYRLLMGLPNHSALMGRFAGFGVDIFFALSGFLITYLLIVEQKTAGSIHIGHFYLRRIFRIWPLYFLILAIGTLLELLVSDRSVLLAPFNLDAWKFYMLFVPQVGKGFYTGSLCVVILWSIGVEELFYLIFPWMFRWLRARPWWHLPMVICALLGLKVVVIYLLFKFGNMPNADGWIKTLSMTRFENLLIGSAIAFLVVRHRQLVSRFSWIFVPVLSVLSMVFLLSALNINFYISQSIGPILQTVLTPFIVSLCVAILLALLAFVPRFAKLLENPLLNYLGKISYGLYVYHCLVLTFMTMLPAPWAPVSWWGTFTFTILGTVFMAGVSYRWFERPFLSRSAAFRHI